MDMDYDELATMIDLKIAASLERMLPYMEFDAWKTVKEEIEWLRAP